jgi:hypothetical protein
MSNSVTIKTAQENYNQAISSLRTAQEHLSGLNIHYGACGENFGNIFDAADRNVETARQNLKAAEASLNTARLAQDSEEPVLRLVDL